MLGGYLPDACSSTVARTSQRALLLTKNIHGCGGGVDKKPIPCINGRVFIICHEGDSLSCNCVYTKFTMWQMIVIACLVARMRNCSENLRPLCVLRLLERNVQCETARTRVAFVRRRL